MMVAAVVGERARAMGDACGDGKENHFINGWDCYESLFEKKDSSFFPGGPQKTFVQWNILKFPNIGFFSHVALTLICIRKYSP